MRTPLLASLRHPGWTRALALVAWLGVLAQPCFAAGQPARAGQAGQAHCPHMDGAVAGMPCHAMSSGCEVDQPLTAADPPPAAAPPARPAFAVTATGGGARLGPGAAPRGGTGPPVHIRFCSLSN